MTSQYIIVQLSPINNKHMIIYIDRKINISSFVKIHFKALLLYWTVLECADTVNKAIIRNIYIDSLQPA